MKRIALTQGYTAIIDDEDLTRVALRKWCASKGSTGGFYGYSTGRNGCVLLHRYVLRVSDATILVDHINRDTLDCRKTNLRKATQSQNGCNRGKQTNNTSGYKGVFYHKQSGKWYVRIQADGRDRSKGMFSSPEEAAHVYDSLARELHGEFACINFP